MSVLYLILITVHQSFAGITLGAVHLHFSLILVRKANTTEGKKLN
jgi:hypothetical protein